MANSPQAEKRARQAQKKRLQNGSFRSMMRTMIKKTLTGIQSGQLEIAQAAYNSMVPILDRSATKGLISANKAARHKSRLLLKLRQL